MILSCLVVLASRSDIQSTIHCYSLKKYTELKDAVMTRHERTKPKMFEKLMTSAQMTGRPSAYLHELMSTTSKVGVRDELIRHKFIQALPLEITLIIAAVGEFSNRLLKIAWMTLAFLKSWTVTVPLWVFKRLGGDFPSVFLLINRTKWVYRYTVCSPPFHGS